MKIDTSRINETIAKQLLSSTNALSKTFNEFRTLMTSDQRSELIQAHQAIGKLYNYFNDRAETDRDLWLAKRSR